MRRLALPIVLATTFAVGVFAQNGPYQFYPLAPCRAVDTRGGSAFGGDTTRTFTIRGRCGVPMTAKAVSLNVTVTQATTASWLTIWPSGQPRPFVSLINFDPSDAALGNGAICGLSANAEDLAVYNNSGNVHVIIDLTGYFQ